jgi:hypothetical protein
MMEYTGTGTISFPGFPNISGNFSLIFENDSKATLWLVTNNAAAMRIANVGVIAGNFIGTSLTPNCTVEINTIYFGNVNFNMTPTSFVAKFDFALYNPVKITYRQLTNLDSVRVRRSLANFIFYGTQRIQKKGVVSLYAKSGVNIGGRKVCLFQSPDFKKNIKNLKRNQGVLETCRLWIRGEFGNLRAIEEICEDIEKLCSLASGNYVVPIYEDIYKEGRLCIRYLFPLKTYPFSKSKSPIDLTLQSSQDLKLFLETAYPQYVSLKNSLGFPYVIEMFVSSRTSLPLEVQYVLASTAFECLESYYRHWQALPRINGIKSKMSRMLTGVMPVVFTNAELQSYRDNRNSLIHEGKFLSTANPVNETYALRNLLDRVFLSFLGYRGNPYFNVATNSKQALP